MAPAAAGKKPERILRYWASAAVINWSNRNARHAEMIMSVSVN
jgi:hypothetical protein